MVSPACVCRSELYTTCWTVKQILCVLKTDIIRYEMSWKGVWFAFCPQSNSVCPFVVLWQQGTDVSSKHLILTLYMKCTEWAGGSRRQWQQQGPNVWMVYVYVSVCTSLPVCLTCSWQMSTMSVYVCACEYVWWPHLLRILVCACGRNERQESHLLWCNDCAIWRQERFGAGAAGTSPGDLLAFLLSPSDRCVNSIISKGPE